MSALSDVLSAAPPPKEDDDADEPEGSVDQSKLELTEAGKMISAMKSGNRADLLKAIHRIIYLCKDDDGGESDDDMASETDVT